MYFKNMTMSFLNKEFINFEVVDIISESDKTYSIITKKKDFKILAQEIKFGIFMYINGVDITNEEKPVYVKLYLSN